MAGQKRAPRISVTPIVLLRVRQCPKFVDRAWPKIRWLEEGKA